MPLPRLIALCGHPKSGKSEVQKILHAAFGYDAVDDGAVIRDFAMRWLGLTHDQVHTQKGKLETFEMLGRTWQVREFLGVYGNHLEAMFGPWGIPYLATRNLDPQGRYSFGSVRRDQGLFYKQQGGVVVGVRNPLAGPSEYEFDRFDESLVDVWIDNDTQVTMRDFLVAEQLAALRTKVLNAVTVIRQVAA